MYFISGLLWKALNSNLGRERERERESILDLQALCNIILFCSGVWPWSVLLQNEGNRENFQVVRIGETGWLLWVVVHSNSALCWQFYSSCCSIVQQGVCHTVALPFTLKSILRQKMNDGNSNVSMCKNIIFKKIL